MSHRGHALLALLATASLLAGPAVNAGTITIEWDPVQHAQLAGYRVYHGTSAGDYAHTYDVGTVTQSVIDGLTACTTHFVAVKARHTDGSTSSQFSGELSGWARPEVSGMSPSILVPGKTQLVTVAGTNFKPGVKVQFETPGLSAGSVTYGSCGSFSVAVTAAPWAAAGPVALKVVNPDKTYGATSALFGLCSDADGDSYPSASCGGSDCDDSDPAQRPGAIEQCNAADDDCDGKIDEDQACGTFAINFQPAGSPAVPGFTDDHGLPFSTALGYGWNAGIATVLRQTPLPVQMNGFATTQPVRTWTMELPNGDYDVRVVSGDPLLPQGPQSVSVEGLSVASGTVTLPGQFIDKTVKIPVRLGRLRLVLGGSAVGSSLANFLQIWDVTASAHPVSISFQPAGSAIPPGYQPDHGLLFDPAKGQGWSAPVPVLERAKSIPQVFDTLALVSSPRVWQKTLPSGFYEVSVSAGDPSAPRGPQHVAIEGQVVIHDETTAAGVYLERKATVQVADGSLTVDVGMTGGDTALNQVVIAAAAPDLDADGVPNSADNCPFSSNSPQLDLDGDGVGNVCDPDKDGDGLANEADNCPVVPSANQADADQDGAGNACDPDDDGDGVLDAPDNCPLLPNSAQLDLDGDGTGDSCDPDRDGDSLANGLDNCPDLANPSQEDGDGDGVGNVCDADRDGDGEQNLADNCPLTANPSQANADGDAKGDACDLDDDNDGIADTGDNCPLVASADQQDLDQDGIGNPCDGCIDVDGDGFGTAGSVASTCAQDNCPQVPNLEQQDVDGDGQGNECEPTNDSTELVGYWTLDLDSVEQGWLLDLSEKGLDLAILGAQSSDGLVDGALSFPPGMDARLKRTLPAIDLGNAFSLTAWIRMTSFGSSGKSPLIQQAASGSGEGFSLEVHQSIGGLRLFGLKGNTPLQSSPGVLAPGSWRHVAVSYGNGIARFYVDGQLAGVGNAAHDPLSSAEPLWVGGDGLMLNDFDGVIDELRIYRGTLSADAVWNLVGQGGMACSDADGDGYGYPADMLCPGGASGDCDDQNDAFHPGFHDICGDGVDQDCNGHDLACDCPDMDQDGYCSAQYGGHDCDETSNAVRPGAVELCNGLDDDCDHGVDEGVCWEEAHWTMDADDVQGDVAQDVTGKHPATIVAASVGPGHVGEALVLVAGQDGHAVAASDAALDMTGAFTLSAWIYPQTFGEKGTGAIVDRFHAAGAEGYALRLSNTASQAGLAFYGVSEQSQILSTPNVIQLNQWQHVAVTHENGVLRFWVNGAAAGVSPTLHAVRPTAKNLYIGNSNSLSRDFHGRIDEVRVYGLALTQDEIQASMAP